MTYFTVLLYFSRTKHFTMLLINTLTDRWLAKQLSGLNVLLKDTLMCGQEEPGIEPITSSTTRATVYTLIYFCTCHCQQSLKLHLHWKKSCCIPSWFVLWSYQADLATWWHTVKKISIGEDKCWKSSSCWRSWTLIILLSQNKWASALLMSKCYHLLYISLLMYQGLCITI